MHGTLQASIVKCTKISLANCHTSVFARFAFGLFVSLLFLMIVVMHIHGHLYKQFPFIIVYVGPKFTVPFHCVLAAWMLGILCLLYLFISTSKPVYAYFSSMARIKFHL